MHWAAMLGCSCPPCWGALGRHVGVQLAGMVEYIRAILIHHDLFQVSTEHYYFWISGLESFCSAEQELSELNNQDSCPNKAGRAINKATIHYYKGLSSAKVVVLFDTM